MNRNKKIPNDNLEFFYGRTGIRTQVRGFKVLGANHYTMRPFLYFL